MKTISGQLIDLSNPDPDTIDIDDIIWHLAFIPRWGGAIPHFYSVAEHSIAVYKEVYSFLSSGSIHDVSALFPSNEDQVYLGKIIFRASKPCERKRILLWSLLHDAHEAYGLGDVISPVGNLIGEKLKAFKRQMDGAIALSFGMDRFFPDEIKPFVKAFDNLVMHRENQWRRGYVHFQEFSPEAIRKIFKGIFNHLMDPQKDVI